VPITDSVILLDLRNPLPKYYHLFQPVEQAFTVTETSVIS